MATAIGISSTYDVTLASGAIAQKVDRTRSLEPSEVVGVDGEVTLIKALALMKTEVSISGIGLAPIASVAVGTVATPADIEIISAEQGEVNNGRATFSLKASGTAAIPSASTGGTAGSAVPDEHTINIVGVSYSLTQDCRVSVEVVDLIVQATDGTVGFRAKFSKKFSFSANGKGDIPANVGIGAVGAKHFSVSGGATMTTSLTDSQVMDGVQSWSFDAINRPSATAG